MRVHVRVRVRVPVHNFHQLLLLNFLKQFKEIQSINRLHCNPTGCLKKVVPFQKSPKFDYKTYHEMCSMISFVNYPNKFKDGKKFVFIT